MYELIPNLDDSHIACLGHRSSMFEPVDGATSTDLAGPSLHGLDTAHIIRKPASTSLWYTVAQGNELRNELRCGHRRGSGRLDVPTDEILHLQLINNLRSRSLPIPRPDLLPNILLTTLSAGNFLRILYQIRLHRCPDFILALALFLL